MKPNQSSGILLFEGRLSVRCGNREQECSCRVTFDLARDHHVLIDCMETLHNLGSPLLRVNEQFQVSVPGTGSPVECHILGPFRQPIIGDDLSVYLTLWPRSAFIGANSGLSKLDGGIVNFKRCHIAPGRVHRLEDDTWTFELTPVEDSRFLYPSQIQNSSYMFTHHLLLRRRDSATFTLAEAERALETLATFLSFGAERWVAPALLAGFDQSGVAVVQHWGTARVDALGTSRSWLDEDHGDVIAEIYPSFSRLMEDANWRATIRTAVYWYVRANTNDVGPDGAIVLVQAALERLTWHILVIVKRSISKRGFSNLTAADQLRLVLATLSIPSDLPPRLKLLTELAGQKGEQRWGDGPQAFTETRNAIVHPKENRRVKGGHAFYEALQLGKWYLELILLNSFGFQGNYACRLDIPMSSGNVEPVPWAKLKS